MAADNVIRRANVGQFICDLIRVFDHTRERFCHQTLISIRFEQTKSDIPHLSGVIFFRVFVQTDRADDKVISFQDDGVVILCRYQITYRILVKTPQPMSFSVQSRRKRRFVSRVFILASR